jgi:hypothetical protein
VNDFRIRIDGEEKYADYTIRKFTIHNQSEVFIFFIENKSILFKIIVFVV